MAEDQRGMGELARVYAVLGVEHTSPGTTIAGEKPRCRSSRPQYGEVSIHCQFSSKDAQELKVSVQWHHAAYADFLLEAV